MDYSLVYAAEVFDDLQQNVNWYNEKQAGLGARFFKAVKERISQIAKNPYSIVIRYENIRCAKVTGFLFMIHFIINQEINIIKIIAVFNTYRDPEIWKKRIKK